MTPAFALRVNDAGGPAWWPQVVTWPIGWLTPGDDPAAVEHPTVAEHPAANAITEYANADIGPSAPDTFTRRA